MEASDRSQDERVHEAIGHYLNNILTSIGGYADQVASILSPRDPARRDLEKIHLHVRQASILAALILPGPRASPSPVELAQVVEMASRLARTPAREIDARIGAVPPGTIVYADPVHLLRVLLDLVQWMSASAESAGEVAPTLVLSLAERGALRGVRITSPRTDGSLPPEEVRGRARELGADLVGGDGVWELLLPAEGGAERKKRKGSRLHRVLVAEPDAQLRSFLVSALHAEHVDEASSGAAAEEVLRKHAGVLDLVVLSLDLDHLDVLARYRELRAANAETGFVFICRDRQVGSELLPLAQSDERALVAFKPFSVAKLANAIHKMTATCIARSKREES